MKDVEILVDGELAILYAAENMHEVGKKVAKSKPMLAKANPGAEISVYVDGVELKNGPVVDVRLIARNMKTQWLENKLLNCHEI